jgi:hypothetical protein
MDAMLQVIDNATTLTVTSAQPANQAGIAAVALASTTLTAGDGNGDYTIANGDTSGRKLTVAQQASISISASGTATHVVLDDGTNIYVTTCTSQALTSGGTVTVPAFDIEVADPS